jgi:hypothetical protein
MNKKLTKAIEEAGVDSNVAEAIGAALERQMAAGQQMLDLGFEQDEFGQFVATGCRVVIYQVDGDYEIDIILPRGGALGFDVPVDAISAGEEPRQH